MLPQLYIICLCNHNHLHTLVCICLNDKEKVIMLQPRHAYKLHSRQALHKSGTSQTVNLMNLCMGAGTIVHTVGMHHIGQA